VQLAQGSKNYTCDVPFHDSFGMNGTLTIVSRCSFRAGRELAQGVSLPAS
jgi:hypothetical protein